MHAHCMPVHNKEMHIFCLCRKEVWNVALVCAACIAQRFAGDIVFCE